MYVEMKMHMNLRQGMFEAESLTAQVDIPLNLHHTMHAVSRLSSWRHGFPDPTDRVESKNVALKL